MVLTWLSPPQDASAEMQRRLREVATVSLFFASSLVVSLECDSHVDSGCLCTSLRVQFLCCAFIHAFHACCHAMHLLCVCVMSMLWGFSVCDILCHLMWNPHLLVLLPHKAEADPCPRED